MEKTVRECLQHKKISIHFDAIYKDLEVEEDLWNRQLEANKMACNNIIKGKNYYGDDIEANGDQLCNLSIEDLKDINMVLKDAGCSHILKKRET